jgi:hypothetical protein
MKQFITCQCCGEEVYEGQYAYVTDPHNVYCEDCRDEFLETIKDRVKHKYEYDGTGYGADAIYHINGVITDDKDVFTDYDEFCKFYAGQITDEFYLEIEF